MRGIDVSVHNGTIDFKKIKAAGYDFVIIRAGYGRYDNQKDTKFEMNYKNAKAAGLHVGAYFYSYAKTSAEAQQEAKVFLNWIKGKTFDMPIYFDIEDPSQAELSRKKLTDICIAWCNAVEQAGYYVGIYANVDWFKNKLDQNRLAKYDKWLAHWADKPIWGDEFGGLWQFSSTGMIDGHSCKFDLNESYRDYPKIIKEADLNGCGAVEKPKVSETNNSETKKPKTYKVKKGDSLWAIAQEHLGNGSRYPEIKSLNNLTNDVIYPGQILKLPVM